MSEKGIRQVVSLAAIRVDGGTQVRAAIAEHVVAAYAEQMSEGVTFPEIILFHDGSQHHLADGFHRCLASLRVGYQDIAAIVIGGTKSDAIWYALGANKANGHQMTPQDKKHAIVLALTTWPEKSSRQIAEQIGVNDSYVRDLTRQGRQVGDLHPPAKVTGKDGKSYPATRRTSPKSAPGPASPQGDVADPEDEDVIETAPAFKSRAAVEQRRQRMRTMAGEGYTSRQIAAAIGVSEETCRETMRIEGVDVPGDRATRGTHRHDANRILEHIISDAEGLTADVKLIDFDAIDAERLGAWIDALIASKRALGLFIERLKKEQQKHGQAA